MPGWRLGAAPRALYRDLTPLRCRTGDAVNGALSVDRQVRAVLVGVDYLGDEEDQLPAPALLLRYVGHPPAHRQNILGPQRLEECVLVPAPYLAAKREHGPPVVAPGIVQTTGHVLQRLAHQGGRRDDPLVLALPGMLLIVVKGIGVPDGLGEPSDGGPSNLLWSGEYPLSVQQPFDFGSHMLRPQSEMATASTSIRSPGCVREFTTTPVAAGNSPGNISLRSWPTSR